MNYCLNRIQKWLNEGGQTIASLLKIVLYSKWSVPMPATINTVGEIVILGNGPSLNVTVEDSPAFLRNKMLLAVNFAGSTELFRQLCPGLYVLADPYFFDASKDKSVELYRMLADTVTWEMYLFVPVTSRKRKWWQEILSTNPHIHIVMYNTTPVEGYRWFTRLAFRKGWGSPRPRNVLIPSIMLALRLGFKKIYLAGADHSWLPGLSVNDANQVITRQPHFYKDSEQHNKQVDAQYAHIHLHEVLYSMYIAFRSYFIIRDYAEYVGTKIVNITPGSYIDAFEREVPERSEPGRIF
ncbi:MAG: hypothetical protein J1E02_00620 [Coprobacter sp.]|nr:hypothetical protein [Coprobacter sp.]